MQCTQRECIMGVDSVWASTSWLIQVWNAQVSSWFMTGAWILSGESWHEIDGVDPRLDPRYLMTGIQPKVQLDLWSYFQDPSSNTHSAEVAVIAWEITAVYKWHIDLGTFLTCKCLQLSPFYSVIIKKPSIKRSEDKCRSEFHASNLFIWQLNGWRFTGEYRRRMK